MIKKTAINLWSTLARRERLLLINSQKEFALWVSARGRGLGGSAVDGWIQPLAHLLSEEDINK